ncbi:PIG-L family deacetylase [bacterium]|nr:MAG: PIG-L family deacetylase [bacterium]
MRLFDPDPSLRWLFCLTHPDDEISICAWIRWLVKNGNEVSLSWTHALPVREEEARNAARKLGVPQDRLFFHGATDASVCDEIGVLKPKFAAMMEAVRPDRVVCGAFEQGHLDHDATNVLVNLTFKGPVLEAPFYHVYLTRLQTLNRFSNPLHQEVRPLEPDERGFKIEIAKSYPSQNIWQILFWHETVRRATFRRPQLLTSERLRLQTHRDWRTPNHPERLRTKVEASPKWRRWLAAMDRIGL